MSVLDHVGISICVFGSAARKATDNMSDKDVLIVAADLRTAKTLIQEWRDKGWSVAAYSRSRLKQVAESGSLFIQHLKQEGQIITDSDHWLTDFLVRFTPRDSYHKDIVDSFDLIRPLERLMHHDVTTNMASDLGYVFMRNYAIYRLASEQTYLFDYHALMDELQRMVGFSNDCLDGLHRMRLGKHLYRSTPKSLGGLNHALRTAEYLVEACTELELGSIDSNVGIRGFKTSYATLRDCEAAVLLMGSDLHRSKAESIALESIWRMVTNPRDYSWSVRSIDAAWISWADCTIFGYERSVLRTGVSSFQCQKTNWLSTTR